MRRVAGVNYSTENVGGVADSASDLDLGRPFPNERSRFDCARKYLETMILGHDSRPRILWPSIYFYATLVIFLWPRYRFFQSVQILYIHAPRQHLSRPSDSNIGRPGFNLRKRAESSRRPPHIVIEVGLGGRGVFLFGPRGLISFHFRRALPASLVRPLRSLRALPAFLVRSLGSLVRSPPPLYSYAFIVLSQLSLYFSCFYIPLSTFLVFFFFSYLLHFFSFYVLSLFT